MAVDNKGVALNDEHWQKWYDQYMNDSTGTDVETEYIGNSLALQAQKAKLRSEKEMYTVELARYNGSIPSDAMAFLLSIGDINSTTLEDGTTIVYTSGSYNKVKSAIKRRDEYKAMGNPNASVSKIKGKSITQISDDDLSKLLEE
ncbi:MAG: hypothetical protein JNM96_05725, partial [Bacteroidia bacterium]|nr:hypothetical protein [Bacteroidia bacterium]